MNQLINECFFFLIFEMDFKRIHGLYRNGTKWYRNCPGMVQEWYRNGTKWYRNGPGIIQEWYRNGPGMAQNSTGMVQE